jgi:hypothetical protein
MSRAKQTSDVEDMSNPPRICRPDRSVRGGGKSITNLYRLEALLWTKSFEFFFGYSKNIKDFLHRVKFL